MKLALIEKLPFCESLARQKIAAPLPAVVAWTPSPIVLKLSTPSMLSPSLSSLASQPPACTPPSWAWRVNGAVSIATATIINNFCMTYLLDLTEEPNSDNERAS